MDPKNLVGKKVDNKYEVTRIIGAGGMGAVFEAVHVGTRRRVAIKVISTGDLSKDEQLVGRFQREAQAAGAVDTQHICQVMDTGTDPVTNWPFMVMEFMAGEDVQQLLRRVGPLHADLALRIVGQACIGLQKAHEAHVVHRDIKPANLYLAHTDSGKVIVKLLDFGIAKVKMEHASEMGDAGLTRTGTMLGSPLYMSPEQARGSKHIDHRADLWSLGVVLYEALSGRTPYHHIDALGELIIAICSEPPKPIQDFAPWITPEVAAIVHGLLKQNPNERFQSAKDVLTAIRQLLPENVDVDQNMLVSLSETQRNLVARRLTLPPPAAQSVLLSNVPAQSVPPPHMTTQSAGTTGGIALTERNPQPKKSNTGLILGGAVLSMAIFGGVAYGVVKSQGNGTGTAAAQTQTPATTVTETATATASVSAPGVTPSGTVSVPEVTTAPAQPVTMTVTIAIQPTNAEVTLWPGVEGKEQKMKPNADGNITFTAEVGDQIPIRVKQGTNEIERTIAVTKSGSNLPLIDLKKPPPATAPPKSSGGAATTAPATAPVPTTVKTVFQ